MSLADFCMAPDDFQIYLMSTMAWNSPQHVFRSVAAVPAAVAHDVATGLVVDALHVGAAAHVIAVHHAEAAASASAASASASADSHVEAVHL